MGSWVQLFWIEVWSSWTITRVGNWEHLISDKYFILFLSFIMIIDWEVNIMSLFSFIIKRNVNHFVEKNHKGKIIDKRIKKGAKTTQNVKYELPNYRKITKHFNNANVIFEKLCLHACNLINANLKLYASKFLWLPAFWQDKTTTSNNRIPRKDKKIEKVSGFLDITNVIKTKDILKSTFNIEWRYSVCRLTMSKR